MSMESDKLPNPKDVFGARLSDMIERSGMSVDWHSQQSGLKDQSLYHWARGSRLPSGEMLIQLADYFQVSVDYLLGRSDEKTLIGSELFKDLGLTEAALANLRRFKTEDVLVADVKLTPGRQNCLALSEALASPEVLNVLAAIMSLPREERGFFEGTNITKVRYRERHGGKVLEKVGDFYDTKLSPDSAAALLYHRLQLTLNQLRTGEKPKEYGPFKKALIEAEMEAKRREQNGQETR